MEKKLSLELKDNIIFDLPASIVVFLVALPLCLGIALASGAPLFSGILAGTIGAVVAGSLSGSPLSVSGPAAGLTSVVFTSIQEVNSFSVFLSCVVLAGMLQILLGYLRAGVIGHFVPVAVIKGMLAAIGLILILKQIPHAVGYDVDFEGDESFVQSDGENTFTDILQALNYFSGGAILVTFVSVAILILFERPSMRRHSWLMLIPAPLLVVLAGILLNGLFSNYFPVLEIKSSHLVSFPSAFKNTSLPGLLTFPDFSQWANPKIYTIAITLALVASLETLLSIEAADKLDPFKRITPLNRELKAQGVANMMSGLVGGLPVTSVIVRTSANVAAGARTKISAIAHGILLMSAVLLFPTFLELIPLASLATILLMVGYKLASIAVVRGMYEKGLTQFLPFLITIVAILLSDLLMGVFIGLLASLFFVIKTNFKTAVLVVNDETEYLVKFTKDVSFLNKSSLRNVLEKIPKGSALIIDGANAQFIDQDIIATLEDYIKGAPAKNISVELKKSNRALNSYFRHAE
jgi:MFS superfamily sulfate permease-like transporter